MAVPKRYPDELCGRLVRKSGRPVAHVAEGFEIRREALRLWVRQDEADRRVREDRLSSDEREELKRLRAGNSEVKWVNEILKAASVLFTGELGRPRMRQRP